MRRNTERCYPVEAQQRLSLRPRRRDCFSDAQLLVEPSRPAELLRVVDPTAVSWVDLVVHAVTDSHCHPVRQPDAARPAITRALPRLVILQTCIDVVRVFHIQCQGVDLTERKIGKMITSLAGIVGNADSAVRTSHHPIRVLWVDPQRSEVAECSAEHSVGLRPAESRPRLSAIFGAGYRSPGDEDPLGVIGIHSDLIEGIAGLAPDIISRRVCLAPGSAAIIGPIDFAADQSLARRSRAVCRAR